MSRFKLFSLFSMMAAMISVNPKLSADDKAKEKSALNRKSGGMLFGGSHIPSNLPNQRQRRKLAAQTR